MKHLSIDLDYWLFQYIDMHEKFPDTKGCIDFIKKVQNLNVPTIVVEEHHEILPFINQYYFDTIINVDFHSDLPELPFTTIEEGSWPLFYKHRQYTNFRWYYPDYKECVELGYGRCDLMRWTGMPMNYANMGHKSIRKYEGLPVLKGIHSVSISLSKGWCEESAFVDVVYDRKLFPKRSN